jgi:exopolysaccharide biosynthesis polyprenyl glycosylphosphotransferase
MAEQSLSESRRQGGRQGTFFYPLALVTVDLASIALPAWFFINGVSFAYALVIAVMQTFIFRENSLYWRHSALYKAFWPQFTAVLRAYIPIFIIFCVISFISQAVGSRPQPGDLLQLFAVVVGLTVALRLALTALIKLTSFGPAPGWLVIGASPRARMINDEIKNEPGKMRFLGFVVDRGDGRKADIASDEIVAPIDGLEDAITLTGASNAVVVVDDRPIEDVLEIVDRVAACPVVGFIYNEAFDIVRQRYKSLPIGGYTVTSIETGARSEIDGLFSRMLDIMGAVFFLALFSPLFLVIARAIKLNSWGPVFFLSDRVRDRAGGTFRFYKFRSMRVRAADPGAERSDDMDNLFAGNVADKENTKITPKGAVTRVGRFLRKYSLDELPQLINVLKGDMSLVGPRPCLAYEYERYKEWHKRRLDAKPGMTGLWQVVARSKTSFDEQAILDIYYSDHRTIWFDIEILLKTIPVVLYGRGGG